MQKNKMAVWEGLKIAVKRREVKSKGEKERYKHLNAEFQRIARRDKAFLSGQCKEIEENNRMGKTRELFKKIRDTKGTFPGGFAGGSDSKASVYNEGDPGSIPGLGRSSEEGNGNPLQYSCLESSTDGGAW